MRGRGLRSAGRFAVALLVTVALAVLTLPGPGAEQPATAAHARPNVLVIMTDDQRADGTLRVMDATRREFAQRGTRFTRAYATTPVCCPARSSFFTGQYTHNHGVKTNTMGNLFRAWPSWQRYLHQAGYTTGLFGKFLNGWNWRSRGLPYWSRYFVGFNKDHADGTDPESDSFLARNAVRFLDDRERNDARPWALMVSTHSPHGKFVPAHRYEKAAVPGYHRNAGVRERDLSDKPAAVRRNGWRHWGAERAPWYVRRQQLRMLMATDDLVARIFQALRRNREYNTLAFFISDNGLAWGEQGLVEKFFAYPASTRVPLLVRWPNHVAEGGVDRRLVANIDVAPTIFAATGIVPTREPDGRSLFDDYARDWLLLELPRPVGSVPIWRAYVSKSIQYTRWHDGFREYYDLADDPWETHNLMKRRSPPDVSGLNTLITQAAHCAGADCP